MMNQYANHTPGWIYPCSLSADKEMEAQRHHCPREWGAGRQGQGRAPLRGSGGSEDEQQLGTWS